MEPIATAENEPSVAPLPDVSELLDGMPRQRGPATVAGPTVQVPLPAARPPHPWRLLPTPTGTPFTFASPLNFHTLRRC